MSERKNEKMAIYKKDEERKKERKKENKKKEDFL